MNQETSNGEAGRLLPSELRAWLDQKSITSENIGDIRRQCFMPWGSGWNALVRDETAMREKSPNDALCDGSEPPQTLKPKQT